MQSVSPSTLPPPPLVLAQHTVCSTPAMGTQSGTSENRNRDYTETTYTQYYKVLMYMNYVLRPYRVWHFLFYENFDPQRILNILHCNQPKGVELTSPRLSRTHCVTQPSTRGGGGSVEGLTDCIQLVWVKWVSDSLWVSRYTCTVQCVCVGIEGMYNSVIAKT